MGSMFSSSMMSQEQMEAAINKAKEISTSAAVVVFSKTYCGYCRRVTQLLTQLGATFKIIELDEERDGNEIQSALAKWTGQRTVPNVFIGGKHIGGCDSTLDKYHSGELLALLNQAGAIDRLDEADAIANTSAQL